MFIMNIFMLKNDISENFQEAPNSLHNVLGIQEEFSLCIF
jgi:hypothetical protein